MMTLVTLIKREVYDQIAYFIGAVIFSAILILLFTGISFSLQEELDEETLAFGLSIPVIIALIFGFPAMGVTQMYLDKNRKISAFLLTLPTTRGLIFSAKIITAILVMLAFFVPLILTTIILYRIFMPPIPIYEGVIFDVFSVIILTAFACYCIGLQAGWSTGRFLPTFGSLAMTGIIATLILVKGFGPHAWIILSLFILASVIRTWQKFILTPL